MKNKIILLLFVVAGSLYSYPWPIRPFDEVHTITATLGDFREGRGEDPNFPRFHNGVDIGTSINTDVFAIESGSCQHSGEGDLRQVRVGGFAYVHLHNRYTDGEWAYGITDTSTTDENPSNDHPTRVGETILTHVHLAEGPAGGPYVNPLRLNDGLNDYLDPNRPYVWEPDFFPSGIELQDERDELSPNSLSGEVEIRAKIRDFTNASTIGSGIYEFEYFIFMRRGSLVCHVISGVFDQVTPPNNGTPVAYIYDTTESEHAQSATFHYWCTNPIINHQVENRYWNTKLRQGEKWDGEDAENYEEACGAQSRADFIHKMQIVLKEIRESIYWLKLIKRSELLSVEDIELILEESKQISNIIAKSIITARKNDG